MHDQLPFTGAALDRAGEQRKDAGWVASQLRDPAARAVAVGAQGVVVRDGAAPSLRRVALRDGVVGDPQTAVLLGLEAGAARFALDLDALEPDDRDALVDGATVVPLREAGTLLGHAEAGLAAYATAMLNWHRRHRFCANCGSATAVVEGGASRHCPACGATHFPRTDPVVIMSVEHDGRLLLGRRSGMPTGRMSVLAGFVSPGESAEEAVAREVMEESGIAVRDPIFVASQPWPFPASLMLGFHAESDGGEPRVGDGELAEVGWFERRQVAAAGDWTGAEGGDAAGGLGLPPPISIARHLIDHWLSRPRG